MSGDVDPAYPERRPDVFRRGRCAQCVVCYFAQKAEACVYAGGPYDRNFERNEKAFVEIR